MNSTNGKPKEDSGDTPRILAYCHDGVGLGHLRRTLNICEHVGKTYPKATFLVATGSPYVSLFKSAPHVDFLKLPSISKVANDQYAPKFLALAPQQILRCRESILLETARHFDPHMILIDKAPVGVCGELLSTLRWIRENRPNTKIVFGMRDIEDDARVTVEQWDKLDVPAMLESFFDEVWVYGERGIFDVVTEYKLSACIQDKLRFMGYVARKACDHRIETGNGHLPKMTRRPFPRVLVTVGGGTDGIEVLRTYLGEAAARVSEAGGESFIVTGPDLPEEGIAQIKKQAAGIRDVECAEFVSCMSCHIRRADLVVCMGGYNTLCEVARANKPALVIPRVKPRLEQEMRADLWAKRGIVDVLHPAQLDPKTLADRVLELAQRSPGKTVPDLNLRGLDSVCDRFGALLNGVASHAVTLPL